MRRARGVGAAAAWALAAFALLPAGAPVAGLRSAGGEPPADALAGEARRGLARGRVWLAAQQRPDGTFPSAYQGTPGGEALVLWALLAAGAPSADPAVVRALAYVRAHADPAEHPTPYGNYTAALGLVALWAHAERRWEESAERAEAAASAPATADPEARRAALVKALPATDRKLAARLVRYVRACAGPNRWNYSAIGTPQARLRERAPALALLTGAAAPPGEVGLLRPSGERRIAWSGDNSNAQYGWLGLRAGALLGVALDDDAFVRGEVERLLATRRAGNGAALRLERDGRSGFAPLWPAAPGDPGAAGAAAGAGAGAAAPGGVFRGNVLEVGWAYAEGAVLPTMTAGAGAALIYAWQEAEERGLMTDPLRAEARAAVLGAVAGLFGVQKKDLAPC